MTKNLKKGDLIISKVSERIYFIVETKKNLAGLWARIFDLSSNRFCFLYIDSVDRQLNAKDSFWDVLS